MERKGDLEVELTFVKNSILQGFYVKERFSQFHYIGEDGGWSCHFYSDEERFLVPGEKVRGVMYILWIEEQRGKIWEGMPFEMKAGQVLLCTGIILKVVNPRLRQID